MAVMLWFFNCVLAIVPILPEKTMERQVKILGNLQNHRIHLQNGVSTNYNITHLGNYNHTILNL